MVLKGRSLPLKRQRPTRPNSPQLGAPEGPSSPAKSWFHPIGVTSFSKMEKWRNEAVTLPGPLGSQSCLLMSDEAEFQIPDFSPSSSLLLLPLVYTNVPCVSGTAIKGEAMAEAITTVLTTNSTYVNRASWGILGYYQTNGTVGSVQCQSGSVYITNTDTTGLGACCHSTATGCAFGVSCDGPVIFWAGGASSSTCSETCRGRTVVGSADYEPWTASSYVCMEADDYRTDLSWTLEVPVTTTITGSASYISSVKDAETSTATPAPPPSTVATATAPPESGNEDDGGNGTNVGAIVGGVVGGVAGLTLILAALWFYMRRRKQKEGEMRELGAGYVPPTQDK